MKVLGIILACCFVLVIGLASFASCSGSGGLGYSFAASNAVARAAILLEQHLLVDKKVTADGKIYYDLDAYNPNDPFMQPVIQYWIHQCGGVLCGAATSGNLQCVEFVTGAFAMAGVPLTTIGNAIDFWSLYQNKPGWREIPVKTGLPMPGDMIIWNHPPYGHIAIVVRVVPPTEGKPGSVTVAQGNAPPTDEPGNLYTMPLRADGSVGTWNDYSIMGFIRQLGAPSQMGGPCPLMEKFVKQPRIHNSPYVPIASEDASKYGIPSTCFINQITQESEFDPYSISPAGAEGIAQFMPGTAAGMGLNVWELDHLHSLTPQQLDDITRASLDAGARLMGQYYQQYAGSAPTPHQLIIAYAMALAAYNSGTGTVEFVTSHYVDWYSHLPQETRDYITAITGWTASDLQ